MRVVVQAASLHVVAWQHCQSHACADGMHGLIPCVFDSLIQSDHNQDGVNRNGWCTSSSFGSISAGSSSSIA